MIDAQADDIGHLLQHIFDSPNPGEFVRKGNWHQLGVFDHKIVPILSDDLLQFFGHLQ